MTQLFAVNENNDIHANEINRLAIVVDLNAALQYCEHVVQVRFGEMIYAADRGIQFLDNVFSGSPNLLLFESQIRTALLRIPDVISVIDFTATVNDNVLSYTATIQTIYGTGTIDGGI